MIVRMSKSRPSRKEEFTLKRIEALAELAENAHAALESIAKRLAKEGFTGTLTVDGGRLAKKGLSAAKRLAGRLETAFLEGKDSEQ